MYQTALYHQLTTQVIYIYFLALDKAALIRGFCRRDGFSSLFPTDTRIVGIFPFSWGFRRYFNYPFVYILAIYMHFNMLMAFFKGKVSKSKPCGYNCLYQKLVMICRRILLSSASSVLLKSFGNVKTARY